MLLLVGLGNPGPDYAGHRHNVGFMAVDALAETLAISGFSSKFQGDVATAEWVDEARRPSEPSAREAARSTRQHADVRSNQKLILLKPMTYMNNSGRSVQAAMAFYKLKPEQVIVIYDELDLPVGKIRIKKAGGANGHNGIKDIDAAIGQDYWRIRIGINHPGHKDAVHGHVLSNFSKEERKVIDTINSAIAKNFPLFWQHSPEVLGTKIAAELAPPKEKKEMP